MNVDRLRELQRENERLTGLVDCDLDATTRHVEALEDENERLRRRILEQAHTLSAASRNTLQDRLMDVAAERDALRATLAEVEALCDSHGPNPHRAACHRCADQIRAALDFGGQT